MIEEHILTMFKTLSTTIKQKGGEISYHPADNISKDTIVKITITITND